MKHGSTLQVDCYVDASFAPLWNVETTEDSSKSRTGYVILIDDVPISWCSKKQGETALSTTEAEYIALSMAMRELLWVRRLVEDISSTLDIGYNRCARIISTVFEDNQGSIAVASKPDITPRTRHLHTKYHHFKENLGVRPDGSGIKIEYLKTEEQIADLFTKGLGNKQFACLRDKLMGWSVADSNESKKKAKSMRLKGRVEICSPQSGVQSTNANESEEQLNPE